MTVVAKVRQFGRGYWIYLPKTVYKLVGEPSSFEITVEGEKLILSPK